MVELDRRRAIVLTRARLNLRTEYAQESATDSLVPADWLRYYFPAEFSRSFTSQQQTFLDWGETIQANSRNVRPRVQCDPRGLGKSTLAESQVVRLMARKARRYCLYISATDDQAIKHLLGIKRRLETPELLRDYPHLRPKLDNSRGAIQNWSRQRLLLAGGQVIEAVSLLGHMRGFKSEANVRPDLMVLDDIDADPSAESQDVVQKKLDILRTEILPAGNEDTVVLFPQNLIHRNSICAQVLDHRADILSKRDFSGPHRLLKWYDAEKVSLPDGSREWKITAGESADPAIEIGFCENLLNRFGKEAFDRECQQVVDQVSADKDFREWNELYHVCTVSEVMDGFRRAGATHELRERGGRLVIPDRWEVGTGLDWGTTDGHPSVFVPVTRPDLRYPFSDIYFVLGEVCLPEYPRDLHDAPPAVSPGRVARAIRQWMADHAIERDGRRLSGWMSHEASAARNTFLHDLPEDDQVFFTKWKAAKGSGVPQIQNLLEIDRTKPHPFRVHPVTGEALTGRPRLIFVVADGQGELYADTENVLRVRGAKDSDGIARGRFEMPLYSHKATGKKKLNDDFVDAFRGCMAAFAVQPGALTESERLEVAIPEAYRRQNAPVASPDSFQKDGWEMARDYEIGKARKKLGSKQKDLDNPWEAVSPFETADFGFWKGEE